MPLYEYQCEKCGKVFEVMQKFSDEPLTKHPECGGKVDKLMSAPAFHLKGSGWYVTDYGKGGAKRDAGKESSKESSSESKSEAKSESSSSSETKTDSSKSDAKTETKTETKKDKPAAATS